MEDARSFLRRRIEGHVIVRRSDATRLVSFEPGREDLSLLFDFRAVLLDPDFLDAYTTLFWERYGDEGSIQICGLETAAIPLVAAIVLKGRTLGKNANGLYMRKERKLIGLQRRIEGTPNKDPVVLVDDLINSGHSIEKQLAVLLDAGLSTPHAFTIIRCGEKAAYPFLNTYGTKLDSVFAMKEFDIKPFRQPPTLPRLRSLWRFRGNKPQLEYDIPKSAPVLHEGFVIFGSDPGTLWALSQEDGSVRWKHDIGFHGGRKGILSSPAVLEGVVYFGGYDGNVYALDALTGSERWIYRDADWIGSSPALAQGLGLVFIGLEFGLFGKRGGIAALDLKDGSERWVVRDMPLHTHASPLYIEAERAVVIGSNDGILRSYDAVDGKPRWIFETKGALKARAAYDETTDLIFTGSFDGNVYALDVQDGKEVWRFAIGEPVYSDPLVHGGVVYVAGYDKRLHALDCATGKERWACGTFGKISASPCLALGSVWIGSNDGCLREIDPVRGKICSYFQTSERVVNKVAVNEKTGKIFLPTQANELYCLEKSAISDVTKNA